ncbi:hypothetical protein [Tichowtungia aerotolerans]|uniref:DUF3108 domain-containing protein n=1 Tax=Tichowtungia aerotolerans TaxID=2697043 RepID=A0A6P1M6T3_9BACT|nr:hypothetical protein [Tichowtungia aerotolerans]QHI68713.1 hypothetical protein GT409_04375 [Tichowtungia aerotolerans]
MKKREFLKFTAAVSAWLASGKLPLLAGVAQLDAPFQIEPVSRAVPQFVPVRKTGLTGNYTLTYQIIRWNGKGLSGNDLNPPAGHLTLSRSQKGPGAEYRIEKQVVLPYWGGSRVRERQTGTFQAVLRVDADEIPQSWSFRSALTEPIPPDMISFAELSMEGTHVNNTIRLSGKQLRIEQEAPGTLRSEFTLPHLLMNGNSGKTPLRFTMLRELAKIHPDQRLEFETELPVPVSGETVLFDSYLQTGRGVQPIHWLTDKNGLVQIMTHGVENWLLQSVKEQ